jgi:hypothetical protein
VGVNGHFDRIELPADKRRGAREATDDWSKINKSQVLKRRGRIMSECATARGKRLWVISDMDGGTTMLLPEEY